MGEGVMKVMVAVVGMAEVEVGEEGMEGVRDWPDQTPCSRIRQAVYSAQKLRPARLNIFVSGET